MVTLSGSSTAMVRGAVSFSTSLTHASSKWGSVVVWETVTPTCEMYTVLAQHLWMGLVVASKSSSLHSFCLLVHRSC